MFTIEEIKFIQSCAGKVGHNEYGVPLSACNGYRQDEHYWKWLEYRRLNNHA